MAYNLYDYLNKAKDLPVDINGYVENGVNKVFNNADLIKELSNYRVKKLFGEVRFAAGMNGAKIPFQGGICVMWYLTKTIKTETGEIIQSERSIKNTNIITAKPRKGDE